MGNIAFVRAMPVELFLSDFAILEQKKNISHQGPLRLRYLEVKNKIHQMHNSPVCRP